MRIEIIYQNKIDQEVEEIFLILIEFNQSKNYINYDTFVSREICNSYDLIYFSSLLHRSSLRFLITIHSSISTSLRQINFSFSEEGSSKRNEFRYSVRICPLIPIHPCKYIYIYIPLISYPILLLLLSSSLLRNEKHFPEGNETVHVNVIRDNRAYNARPMQYVFWYINHKQGIKKLRGRTDGWTDEFSARIGAHVFKSIEERLNPNVVWKAASQRSCQTSFSIRWSCAQRFRPSILNTRIACSFISGKAGKHDIGGGWYGNFVEQFLKEHARRVYIQTFELGDN